MSTTEKVITITCPEIGTFTIPGVLWRKLLAEAKEKLGGAGLQGGISAEEYDARVGAEAKAAAIARARAAIAADELRREQLRIPAERMAEALRAARAARDAAQPSEPSLLKSAAIHLAASFGISLVFFGALRAAGAIEKTK